jgi:hypothetical protein
MSQFRLHHSHATDKNREIYVIDPSISLFFAIAYSKK